MNLEEILKDEKSFRLKQIREAMFSREIKSWDCITTLSKNLRANLNKDLTWIAVKEKSLRVSNDASMKALLELKDGEKIETVAMRNTKDKWTTCLSTQVGCAMGCAFCRTGKMGFTRNLSIDEIIDQYRFWLYKNLKISNIVIMGMGEPFLNYENTRDALNILLKFAEISQNHIVISTVGIMDKLKNMLKDKEWPNVRLAISLHSAINETRSRLIPNHQNNFYNNLIAWAKTYLSILGSRKRYLSIEYILIADVNDSLSEARALIMFLNQIKHAKVNLILYNQIMENKFKPSQREQALRFQNLIKKAGFACTIRKSFGSDIQGACGQLANSKKQEIQK